MGNRAEMGASRPGPEILGARGEIYTRVPLIIIIIIIIIIIMNK